MSPRESVSGLSKSRFTAGVQCHKLLWWKVHEPEAVELQPDIVLEDRFDQGRHVGALATELFPGGVQIEVDRSRLEEAVAATRRVLVDGAPAIFEACFFEHNTFVAVDILERLEDGYRLIEVKSSSSQKDAHIPDAAVQLYVLRRAGLEIRAVEVMHLNKEFRHPEQGQLFARTDVTDEVEVWQARIPEELDAQLEMLNGPCPEVDIGAHCEDPYECPFRARCWPDDPEHIGNLYNVGAKRAQGYFLRGIRQISELPAREKLNDKQQRQIRAMNTGQLIVEPGLKKALEPFECRIGFLDFETIQRAVPVWPGMFPWQQGAAQFSYHELRDDGTYSHAEFLAEGPEDARPMLAERMIEATAGADRILHYTAFERTQIRYLRAAVPSLAVELEELDGKLIDLAPVIRDHVYHPEFHGSFSLKDVLTPMVPDLAYDDLVIIDGMVASVTIARLLFIAGKLSPQQHEKTRHDLLEYCKRDTWATGRLLQQLWQLVE